MTGGLHCYLLNAARIAACRHRGVQQQAPDDVRCANCGVLMTLDYWLALIRGRATEASDPLLEPGERLTRLKLEIQPGQWVSLRLPHADRRLVLAAVSAERRFVGADQVVMIAQEPKS